MYVATIICKNGDVQFTVDSMKDLLSRIEEVEWNKVVRVIIERKIGTTVGATVQ